ncbi:hypothetical protein KO02_09000 [Sphingobacterium sp. ML3W]|nr:hypothetical protein KO02_09000 [Sphingobacterium sp. ML3W]
MFYTNIVHGQQGKSVDFSKALKVGDTFIAPKQVQLMRGVESSIDWKTLKNKVVLLDFFSTSCGTCIQIMPHLQELEQKHPDKFKVIVVTAHDKATLEKFFETNAYLKKHKVNLPIIYADRYFHELFPHQTEPHGILLYQGKVQAITGSGSINETNILELYADKTIDLPLKDDYGKGSLLDQMDDVKTAVKAGVIFSGYQDGVPYQAWTFEKDSLTGLHKSSVYNTTLYSALLSLTTRAKIKDSSYIPRMERVIWKVKDSTQYYDFEDEQDEWVLKNGFSYERYDIRERPDSVQARLVLADFLSFFGVKAYEGKKLMNCLVLENGPIVPYSGSLIDPMSYTSSTTFSIFTDYLHKLPPVIDRVNKNLKMQIGSYETLDELNAQLGAYGIVGKIQLEEISVLVIEEVFGE